MPDDDRVAELARPGPAAAVPDVHGHVPEPDSSAYKEPSAHRRVRPEHPGGVRRRLAGGQGRRSGWRPRRRRRSRSTTSSRRRRSSGRTRRRARPMCDDGHRFRGRRDRRRPRKRNVKRGLTVLLFMSPWILGFLLLTLYPMVSSLYFSFTNYSLLDEPVWIGLAELLVHVHEGSALLAGVPQHGLDHRWSACRCGSRSASSRRGCSRCPARASRVYRTLYFLPSMAPPAAAALAFVLSSTRSSAPSTRSCEASASDDPPLWFYGPARPSAGCDPRAVGGRRRDDHLPRGPARRSPPAV